MRLWIYHFWPFYCCICFLFCLFTVDHFRLFRRIRNIHVRSGSTGTYTEFLPGRGEGYNMENVVYELRWKIQKNYAVRGFTPPPFCLIFCSKMLFVQDEKGWGDNNTFEPSPHLPLYGSRILQQTILERQVYYLISNAICIAYTIISFFAEITDPDSTFFHFFQIELCF